MSKGEQNCKMYSFGNRLRALREREHISQSELARTLQLTRATISAWEMEVNEPNAQSLIILSKYFGVTSDYLLGLISTETIDISRLNIKEKGMVRGLVSYFLSLKDK